MVMGKVFSNLSINSDISSSDKSFSLGIESAVVPELLQEYFTKNCNWPN